MRSVSELSVFIASPSDVASERKTVREVCDRLSRDPLIRGYGLAFKATGSGRMFFPRWAGPRRS